MHINYRSAIASRVLSEKIRLAFGILLDKEMIRTVFIAAHQGWHMEVYRVVAYSGAALTLALAGGGVDATPP